MADYEIGARHKGLGGLFEGLLSGKREAATYTYSGSLEGAKSEAERISRERDCTVELRRAGQRPGISHFEDGEAWFSKGEDVTMYEDRTPGDDPAGEGFNGREEIPLNPDAFWRKSSD